MLPRSGKNSPDKIKLTLAISSGARAPLISCLFARISKDAPDSLCHMKNKNKNINIWKYY